MIVHLSSEYELFRYARMADNHYAKQQFRDALICGFDLLLAARDRSKLIAPLVTCDVNPYRYRNMVRAMHDGGYLKDLLLRFLQYHTVLIAPICPHYAEHVWSMLGVNQSL